jgi:hypothetical protein
MISRYWIAYIIGIALPFCLKYGNYMLKQNADGRYGLLTHTLRFLFDDVATATKTLINFGGELAFGVVWIDRLPLPFADLKDMPQHVFFCFFLGLIAETVIVPPCINFVHRRLELLSGAKA